MNKKIGIGVFIAVVIVTGLIGSVAIANDIRYNTDKNCQCGVELQNWVWEGKEHHLNNRQNITYIPYQGEATYHLYNKFSEVVCCRAYIEGDIVQWAVFLTSISNDCYDW